MTLTAFVNDGPCQGSYDVVRCSERMVFTIAADGRQYALDAPGDRIEPGEVAYLYEAEGGVGWICGSGRGLPCRFVTYRYAGTVDPDTGVFHPAAPGTLEQVRKEARKRMLALAVGERDTTTSRARGRAGAAPETTTLF